jgi:uncharacterized protein
VPDTPDSMLAHAVLNDWADLVEAQLRQGADIFAHDRMGRTLLAAAVLNAERNRPGRATSQSGRMFANAQARISELFLAHALALPPERFSLGDAVVARHLAAVNRCLASDPPTAANARAYADALTICVRRDDAELLEQLLAAGADSNARVTEFDRAWIDVPMLGLAAARGAVSAIGVLLAHGAEVEARLPQAMGRPGGATPLMMAAHTSSLPAVKALLQAGADLGARDDAGQTALQHARAAGRARLAAFLEKQAEVGDTAADIDLWTASAKGPAYRVRDLLDAGADPDARDTEGRTPLMLAVGAGQTQIAEMLIDKGADVLARHDREGAAGPLQVDLWAFAFAHPKADVIETLLRRGLDPNRQAATPVPPLVRALGDAAIVRVLLTHGADVHAPVPPSFVARVRAQRERSVQARSFLARRRSKVADLPPEIGERCSVLDYAFYFGGAAIYQLMAGTAGVVEERAQSSSYLRLREALKQCASLADDTFKAEAERIGAILRSKPQAWRRRRGVMHYVSPLTSALRAYYADAPIPLSDPRGQGLSLLQRLQAEVSARGYTLAYTGLQFAEKGPVRLLLFPLNEPLAPMAAAGTNAANYGLGTADLVEWCDETARDHPLSVIGAGFDFVELGFTLPLRDPEALTRRLAEFCPDLQVREGDPAAIANFAQSLARTGRCFLWWD